ncbi:MAG: GIY-YIG nuclease family protein [Proteobacteria bacterium]|nr:GIY-YIG nuclease family protein [Pseudomonadota bacterium]
MDNLNHSYDIDTILSQDPLGILDEPPEISWQRTEQQNIQQSFRELHNFFSLHEREPKLSEDDFYEHLLRVRLDVYREDVEIREMLKDADEYQLLLPSDAEKSQIPILDLDLHEDKIVEQANYSQDKPASEPPQPDSLDDILIDDALGLLDDDDQEVLGLFELKHVSHPHQVTRQPSSYTASRRPCKNFKQYVNLFRQCYYDIHMGHNVILPTATVQKKSIEKGDFFILQGQMIYIADIHSEEIKNVTNDRPTKRLHSVYDNKTESHILTQETFLKRLNKEGRRVVPRSKVHNLPRCHSQVLGYLYICRSLSQDPNLKKLPHLYKIGFSNNQPRVRVQQADKEATFLCSAVEIVKEIKCFYINSQKLETMVHRFFSHARLDIELTTQKTYKPREWFMVPLEVIDQGLKLFLENAITEYQYNHITQRIEPKATPSERHIPSFFGAE